MTRTPPVGGPQQPSKNAEIDQKNIDLRSQFETSEITGSIYPRALRGVTHNLKYMEATSKKGMTAGVFKQWSVEVQTSSAVTKSPTVSKTFRQLGKEHFPRPMRNQAKPKRHA